MRIPSSGDKHEDELKDIGPDDRLDPPHRGVEHTDDEQGNAGAVHVEASDLAERSGMSFFCLHGIFAHLHILLLAFLFVGLLRRLCNKIAHILSVQTKIYDTTCSSARAGR